MTNSWFRITAPQSNLCLILTYHIVISSTPDIIQSLLHLFINHCLHTTLTTINDYSFSRRVSDSVPDWLNQAAMVEWAPNEAVCFFPPMLSRDKFFLVFCQEKAFRQCVHIHTKCISCICVRVWGREKVRKQLPQFMYPQLNGITWLINADYACKSMWYQSLNSIWGVQLHNCFSRSSALTTHLIEMIK